MALVDAAPLRTLLSDWPSLRPPPRSSGSGVRVRGLWMLADGIRAMADRLDRRSLPARPAASRYFDPDFYLAHNLDVARAGVDPLRHFTEYGWREGRNPNGWFSTTDYLRRYPASLGSGTDPLSHMAEGAPVRAATQPAPVCGPGRGRGPLLRALTEIEPQFPVKWQGDLYLARQLGDMERARSQLHTFALLEAAFRPEAVDALIFDGLSVWRRECPLGACDIVLSRASKVQNEGELSLSFRILDRTAAIVSFNFTPPSPLLGGTGALFVSRMQAFGADAVVGKAFDGVTLQAMLFAAAQGLGEALEVRRLVGVSSARQVAVAPSMAQRAARTYDAFFQSVGARLGADGLYHGPLVADDKPLSEVKPGHKIRTRRRRALKGAIRDEVRARLQALRIEKADGAPVAEPAGEVTAPAGAPPPAA